LPFNQPQVSFFGDSSGEPDIFCQAAAPSPLDDALLREIGIAGVREFCLKIFASGADPEFSYGKYVSEAKGRPATAK
jgi:hypothetical protein